MQKLTTPITINGVSIGDTAIDAEAANHEAAAAPRSAAAYALAIRELLLQRAAEVGLAEPDKSDEAACDAAIERLLVQEAPVPEPLESECRKFYELNRERFVVGELVEAAHILFAVTSDTPLEAIRRQAEGTLQQARAEPGRFAELAQRFSNCPSGAQGGSLGQIHRGQTVPEFENAIFGGEPGVLPRLVNTRFGFHVVRIERHIAGRTLDFDTVQPDIARALSERVRMKAAEQYVRILASRAALSGIELDPPRSALVQ